MRLLRDFPNNDSVILAVECFESRHQAAVDAYIASEKMKEEQFLEAIQWSARWGFPWEHYRPLFELARERKYRVVALNRYFRTRSESNLQKRDIMLPKFWLRLGELTRIRLSMSFLGICIWRKNICQKL